MEIPKGIEGDYLETKENHLFFDIKGYLHPRDRKICFLRFFPEQNGERIKEGKKYKKIYSLEERYLKIREKYPQYFFSHVRLSFWRFFRNHEYLTDYRSI